MNKYYMGGGAYNLNIYSDTQISVSALNSFILSTISRFGIQTTLFRVRHEKEVRVC